MDTAAGGCTGQLSVGRAQVPLGWSSPFAYLELPAGGLQEPCRAGLHHLGEWPTPHIGHSAVQIILQTANLLGKKTNKNIHPQGLVKCRGDTLLPCSPRCASVCKFSFPLSHTRSHSHDGFVLFFKWLSYKSSYCAVIP